ncbi:MAG: hypothetical protein AB7N80_08635 [Bdellovibrionales bacterium]
MDPRQMTNNKTLRFFAVVITVTTLTACQKTRMSSVNRPAPQPTAQPSGPVRPIPPGTPVQPGPNPGVVIPPLAPPPGVVIPPTAPPPPPPTVVIPPRTTPPGTPVPPVGPTPPPVVTTPLPPDVPVVTPLPTTPTDPTTPTLPPVVVTTPPTTTTTPPIFVPPTATPPYIPEPTAPVQIIVPGGNGGAIQIGRPSSGFGVTGVAVVDEVVFPTGMRVQTPIRSEILSTCRGADCYPSTRPFSPKCEKDCSIETVQVERQKPVLTCPEIGLRARPYTNKLDILFVVDTSASMKEERIEIARQMVKFINELSHDVDYRIAVLLGHGPRSKTSLVGELFTPPSKSTDYSVIQIEDLVIGKISQNDPDTRARNGRPSNGVKKSDVISVGRREGAELAAQRLAEMMAKVPNDASEAQGEAGLLNLYTAVRDSRKLNEMQRRGFWRVNAAKAVFFIADENDVCFDYAGTGFKGNYATEGDRRNETDAFNRTDVCAATADGRRLTARHVHDAVQASSDGMPTIFSGVLYLDNKSIPQKRDKYSKDNEMGHGYLDVIAYGKGKALDLGQGNFGPALAKIGDFADFRMKYDHIFPMRNVADVSDIDPVTVEVLIRDGSGKEHMFNGTNVKLELDTARNQAQVIIAYEVLAKIYEGGMVKSDSKIIIRYSTKSGKGPSAADGASSTTKPVVNPAAGETTVSGAQKPVLAPVETRILPKPTEADKKREAAERAEDAERERTRKLHQDIEEMKILYPGG